MDGRVQAHVDNYIKSFKQFIRETLLDDEKTQNEKLESIFAYDNLNIELDNFIKKKRVRNVIPSDERCCAYKAQKDRCTRKRKDGSELCGTHMKGTPHGMINMDEPVINYKKIDVYTQDIGGIIYYIDNNNNVYNSTDIIKGTPSPSIIGKCIHHSDGTYSLVT